MASGSFGSPVWRTLLFGRLAGFHIVPERLAAPYAHSLSGKVIAAQRSLWS
jgi:hypothetical protein